MQQLRSCVLNDILLLNGCGMEAVAAASRHYKRTARTGVEGCVEVDSPKNLLIIFAS
jgi:hypothetical protein